MKKQPEKVPTKLWVIGIGIIAALVVANPSSIVSAAIGIVCAAKCYKWAVELKRGATAAFFIGLLII